MGEPKRKWVVGTPMRTAADTFARALENDGVLRQMCLWTRRGVRGIPARRTRLIPALGLAAYIAARTLSVSRGEAFRFRLLPLYDEWLLRQLRPGDELISALAYANKSFRQIKRWGGHTYIDAGNSHPTHSWDLLAEEHRRWGCNLDPTPRFHHERALRSMEHLDYVFAPSEFVANSYRQQGFAAEQIMKVFYAVDFSIFQPAPTPRPKERPLTVISTGSLSLRKGSPYLLEAFRLVRKEVPDARLLLTDVLLDNIREVMARYANLPIEWAGFLNHAQLVVRLQSADVYVLPSIEEGLAQTSLEALACGLPTIVTPNTGSNDYIVEGVNGSVVPIRDPQAIADRILWWWERVRTRETPPVAGIRGEDFSQAAFDPMFIGQLEAKGLL